MKRTVFLAIAALLFGGCAVPRFTADGGVQFPPAASSLDLAETRDAIGDEKAERMASEERIEGLILENAEAGSAALTSAVSGIQADIGKVREDSTAADSGIRADLGTVAESVTALPAQTRAAIEARTAALTAQQALDREALTTSQATALGALKSALLSNLGEIQAGLAQGEQERKDDRKRFDTWDEEQDQKQGGDNTLLILLITAMGYKGVKDVGGAVAKRSAKSKAAGSGVS